MWALSAELAYSQIFAALAEALPELLPTNSAPSLSSEQKAQQQHPAQQAVGPGKQGNERQPLSRVPGGIME